MECIDTARIYRQAYGCFVKLKCPTRDQVGFDIQLFFHKAERLFNHLVYLVGRNFRIEFWDEFFIQIVQKLLN